MLEFSAETLRLPWGLEMLNLKSLKTHVSFSSVADENDPFAANFMEPLRCGMSNLSVGVNSWRVWACALG